MTSRIDEPSVEPEVKCALVFMEKLNFNIVEYQQLSRVNEKVMIAYRSKEGNFWFLLFVVVVKDAALANHLKVGHEATLLKLGDCDHPNLENFLNYSRYSESRDLYFASMLHEMVEVVNIANLTGNCDTFCIFCSYLSIVDKSIVCSFTKLAIN